MTVGSRASASATWEPRRLRFGGNSTGSAHPSFSQISRGLSQNMRCPLTVAALPACEKHPPVAGERLKNERRTFEFSLDAERLFEVLLGFGVLAQNMGQNAECTRYRTQAER